jgi:hypothetical protein
VICDDDRGLACLGSHQAGNAVNPSLARRVLACDQRRVMFLGVLPAGAHSPVIARRTGEQEFLAVNTDDAYWLTITHDLIAFHWTRADGTVQHVPISTPTA